MSWELVECKFWGPTQELLRQGVSRESVLFLRNADIFSLLMYTFSSLGCLLYSISIPPYKMSWVESVKFKLALVDRATHFQHRPFINLGEGTLSAVPPGSAPPQPSTGFYAANKDVVSLHFPKASSVLITGLSPPLHDPPLHAPSSLSNCPGLLTERCFLKEDLLDVPIIITSPNPTSGCSLFFSFTARQ